MFSTLLKTALWAIACSHPIYAWGDLLSSRDVIPAAISIPPAQEWDGDDGSWSTFPVQVGTPPQDLRVLPSTYSVETWVIVPEGCPPSYLPDCVGARGGTFSINQSTTWRDHAGPYFSLLEENLGYVGNGHFGYDTVALGSRGGNGPSFTHQIVGGILTADFFVGVFGLSPRPDNFSGSPDAQPSFIQNLRANNLIPSTSWGYTAGAPYRLKKVPGSLTLGGYDDSLFTSNDFSFTFDNNNEKDLTVGIQDITTVATNGGQKSLLPSGILALIDSTVSHIWLPTPACKRFEDEFGLVYDSTTELYLVNDTLHESLLNRNPNITFQLGNSISGPSIEITLPYAAFDLQGTYPFVANTTNYFPLRRAANDSQYVIGRTFLQEAYLIVDWDRHNFSISQCVFDQNAKQHIVSILAPGEQNSTAGNAPPPPAKKSSNAGAIAGGVVGGLTAIAIIALIVFWRRRRQRSTEDKAESQGADGETTTPEGSAETAYNLNSTEPQKPGMASVNTTGTTIRADSTRSRPKSQLSQVHELEAEERQRHELPSPVPEVEGSPGERSIRTMSPRSLSLASGSMSPGNMSPTQMSPGSPGSGSHPLDGYFFRRT